MTIRTNCAVAQVNEIAQLALNIEKLRQLKEILKNLERSYTILSKGYNSIKGIAEGNFSVHKLFLDGLYQVSPSVRKYKKIPEIIDYQIQLLKQINRDKRRLASAGMFTRGEMDYVISVYDNLLKLSIKNLDELLMVTTSGKTRMSDDERLKLIDRIHSEMEDKVQFILSFSADAEMMLHNRKVEQDDLLRLQKVEGLGETK